MSGDFLGVIILESLSDTGVMEGAAVLQESDIAAPPGDPYPAWSRRLVRVPTAEMEAFAARLADAMKEDFYNHFVDERRLVVVFKGRYFVLDKRDKGTWGEMMRYGETVRVGPEWTGSIPVEADRLL